MKNGEKKGKRVGKRVRKAAGGAKKKGKKVLTEVKTLTVKVNDFLNNRLKRRTLGLFLAFLVVFITSILLFAFSKPDVMKVMKGDGLGHAFGMAWATALGQIGESVFMESDLKSTKAIAILELTLIVLIAGWLVTG